jgi:murein DD-endopeptidase MepM/ murein hydrolase activator NlpD
VREGERVAQGQRLGALGNSGDSFAPHVHHQLQDGPEWTAASGLPHRYSNIASQRLDRGEFFATH